MAYISPFWPRRAEWLEKAARDAAHELTTGCARSVVMPNPDDEASQHSGACNNAKTVIIKHMTAAMALARVNPNVPTEPIVTLAHEVHRE